MLLKEQDQGWRIKTKVIKILMEGIQDFRPLDAVMPDTVKFRTVVYVF
jgi:hypothetical protein